MKQHITRAYNSFIINKNLGTITKISKELRLKNEINYYKTIESNACSIFFPRLLTTSMSDIGYAMELEYYAYDNLGDYMVYKPFDASFWRATATAIVDARSSFATTHKELLRDQTITTAMYIAKTEKYYYDLINNFKKFKTLSQHDTLIVDGHICRNFKDMWEDVKQCIHHELLSLKEISVIHGDFCFSNILCGVNEKTNTTLLKFVDPRGSFGVDGILGDPYYDAAKLIHSYEGGYEYIIYDKFEIEELSPNKYNIHFANNNKEQIARIFDEVTDLRSIKSKLIEGLIYIGMCSRHYDSEKRQTAMYLNGIKILNKVLEGKIK